MFRVYVVLLLVAVIPIYSAAQENSANTLKITIKNEETKKPVIGAKVSIKDTDISSVTDTNGIAQLNNIPAGDQTIVIFSAGYETNELKLTFPLIDQSEKLVLIKLNNEIEKVLITSTRTGREIDDVPTRVEAIDEEEIDEKSNMRSSNVSMLLNESTGIKVQQTSATSYTQSIRIQGLDGRYTQILKDGFPAFGGFSGSLSLLDIPPLDLKQVEIIKGPAATFYGGGAIAGVVNFISKEPEEKPKTSMILNQTSAIGTDFSIFNSRKFNRIGYTFLGSVNYQKEYDVDDDDFTELPRTKSFNLNPRLFFYLDDKTRLMIGNSTTYQKREGGDVFVIRNQNDGLHQYFELNNSLRNITSLQFDRDYTHGRKITAKQSLAFFDREIEIPNYQFKGRQFNAYTDVSYFHPTKDHALVFGFNAVYDQFKEEADSINLTRRNETRRTFGVYAQDSFSITEKLSMEAGIRLDHVKDYGFFPLPRVSILYKFTDHLSSRFGIGLGYKTPSIFTEEAETLLFQNILPVGNSLKAERSLGGTFDVNYRNILGEKLSYSINHMFFYTKIEDPLVLLSNSIGIHSFINSSQPINTSGFETNVRLSYDIVKLFAGYTFTYAKAKYLAGNQILPLTPKSKINSALLFEKEENYKAGFEAYYTSSQYLSRSRSRTKPYWVLGIFGEKFFGKFSLFLNAENITDTRQSRFGTVVFPPHQNPTFNEIYTHTEGRVFNGGIKIRLF
jgi:outer membrane receptor for ferrienterochelin and colicins